MEQAVDNIVVDQEAFDASFDRKARMSLHGKIIPKAALKRLGTSAGIPGVVSIDVNSPNQDFLSKII
jgi:hypothetical protein